MQNAAPRRERIDWRRVSIVVTAGILVALAVSWLALLPQVVLDWGNDFDYYTAVARDWQATGVLYPGQLDGPYEAEMGITMLYPPISLYLFAPAAILPGFLWWLIPFAIIGWHVWTARPAWWAWPVIALLLFAPRSQAIIIWGNTGIWVAAFVALGLHFAWASPFVLLKPTFAPFALVGIRKRAWWVGLGVFALLSLPMLPLWFDYLTAMTNNVGPWPPGFLYSLPDYLLVMMPVVAWWARPSGQRDRA